jgi:cysteine desulfurase
MIYFDNAATTEPTKEVIDVIASELKNNYANASSVYSIGKQNQKNLSNAREAIGKHFNSRDSRVIFTSCATESNNMILHSIKEKYVKSNKKYNVISTKIEHPSIYNSIKHYFDNENIEIRYIKTDKNGNIDTENYKSLIDDKTLLISISHVNNEIGTKNDIINLSKIAKSINKNSIFHSDTVQSAGKFQIFLDNSDIDAISISGHKFHAPKGVGALIAKKHVKIQPLLYGGSQEDDLRAGTENIAYIKGLQTALMQSERYIRDHSLIVEMREYIIENIQKKLSDVILNTPRNINKASSYIINLAILGTKGEVMLRLLDEDGIAISTSSACSSKKRVSRVLIDAGMDKEAAQSSIRISLSRFNTIQECDILVESIIKNANRLRKVGKYN